MNKNLLMLCFKSDMKGDTRISTKGQMFSTWEFAHARAIQLHNAISQIPDNPEKALNEYFRAKDCLLSDFSVLADLLEATKTFEVHYDELKDKLTVKLQSEGKESEVIAWEKGFEFYQDGKLLKTHAYEETMGLEEIADIIIPFFVVIE